MTQGACEGDSMTQIQSALDDVDLALDYAKRVSRFADTVLAHISITAADEHGAMFVTYALRARLHFMGIICLANVKLVSPASALMRCLAEIQFVVEAVRINPDYADDLFSGDVEQRRKAMNGLKQVPDFVDGGTHDAAIQKILDEVDPQAKGVSVEQWATRANRRGEYQTAYRLLSTDVHATLRGAEEHVLADRAAGQIVRFIELPDATPLGYRLVGAAHSMLAILLTLPDGVMTAEFRQTAHSLFDDATAGSIFQRVLARQAAVGSFAGGVPPSA